jgi:hypothetical protein
MTAENLIDPAKEKAAVSAAAARLSIAAIIIYHLLLFTTIFLRPDIDPSWHTMSEWAIGPWGWVMSSAFIAGGISYALLFITIRSQVRGAAGYIGSGIFAICVIGLFGVGIFTTDNMDIPTDTLSTTGILHIIFGMSQLLLLPFAALLINLGLRKNPDWASSRRPLLLTAFLPLAGFIAFIVHLSIYVIPLGSNAHGVGVPIGWPPRFLFLSYMVWVITVAWQAVKVKYRNI